MSLAMVGGSCKFLALMAKIPTAALSWLSKSLPYWLLSVPQHGLPRMHLQARSLM